MTSHELGSTTGRGLARTAADPYLLEPASPAGRRMSRAADELASARTMALCAHMRSLLPPPAGGPRRIVDVGCGQGRSTAVLHQSFEGASGVQLVGFDTSSEALDIARARAVPSAT